MKNKFITGKEKTIIRNDHHGWNCDTYVKIKGYCYEITTMKRSNGIVFSLAIQVNDEGSSNGFIGVSYNPFTAKRYPLIEAKIRATEDAVKKQHYEALAKFDEMSGELPEKSEAYKIKPGQMLMCVGAGLSEGLNRVIYRVDDDNDKFYWINVKTLQMGQEKLNYLRDYDEKFGIGTYYVKGEMMPQDALENLILDAHDKKKLDAEQLPARQAAAKAEHEAAMQATKEAFPHLEAYGQYCAVKNVAANIRIELKKYFPNQKFSVRSENNSVYISWEDGPVTASVKAVTDKFEAYSSDVTGDFRDYDPKNFNLVFGGCKYVFEQRSMSKATETIFMQWAESSFAEGRQYNSHGRSNLAHRLFTQYDIPQGEFCIERKQGVTSGLNSPETFWEVVEKEAIQGDDETLENFTEEVIDPNQMSMF